MERERVTKAVMEVPQYRGTFDPVKFLNYCGAKFKYLGKKNQGMFEYYAILEMDLPDEFSVCKTEGKDWWVLTGSAGYCAHIELGERAQKRLKEYQEGVIA